MALILGYQLVKFQGGGYVTFRAQRASYFAEIGRLFVLMLTMKDIWHWPLGFEEIHIYNT